MVHRAEKGRKNYISAMADRCGMKNIREGFQYLVQQGSNGENNLKEGYFSVLVQEDGEPRKLFISLRYLNYPPFLRLLDAAEKEFGFDQKGVLVIPCEARVLRNILS